MVKYIIATIASLFIASVAFSHEFWIDQEKYKAPSYTGNLAGTHCCGEKDCFQVEEGIDFVKEGDWWVFLDGPVNKQIQETFPMFHGGIEGDKWPIDYEQTYVSEDLDNWVCVNSYVSRVACFFKFLGGW